MNAVAYLRVSTVAQSSEDRWGYHRQVQDIRAYARREGLELSGEYRDAITGTSVTRVGLTHLIEHASEFDAVIVSGIDRLARDIGAGYAVAETLANAGLQVHSADMGVIDFQDEASTLQFGIFSTLSHAERIRIRKRTEAARIAMAEAGKMPHGVHTYGYDSDGHGGASINPKQARIVRQIFDWRLDGWAMHRIKTELNRRRVPIPRPHRSPDGVGRWHHSPVARLIRNPIYKGEYHWHSSGRLFVIPAPAIVSPDVWRRAQATRRGPKAKKGWMLAGVLRCGECGGRMHAKRHQKPDRKAYEYYRCNLHTRPPFCGAPLIPRGQLEAAVEHEVRTKLTDPDFLEELLGKADSDVDAATQAQVDGLRDELERARAAYQRGVYTLDEFAEARADIDERIAALQAPAPVASEVTIAELAEAAKTLPVGEFLRAARVVVIATRESVRFEFSP